MRSYSEILSVPPTFPMKSIILLVLLKLGLFGALIYYAVDSCREVESSRECLRFSVLSGIIDNLDEVLTMSARMAAVTGDKSWEDRYRNFEPKLDSAIKEARKVGEELHIPGAVEKTNEANIKLMSMENQAFDLVHKGQNQEASAILSSSGYESEKEKYRLGMERITGQINDFARQKDGERYIRNCMVIVFILFAVPAFTIALIVVLVMIKRYENELEKHERRFLDMSEITNNWIWELDSKMRFTYVNPQVKKFIGYTPEEVIGKTPDELMPPSEAGAVKSLMDGLMNNPRPFSDSNRTVSRKDGTSRTIDVNGIPLYDHNDEFKGFRGICHDVA